MVSFFGVAGLVCLFSSLVFDGYIELFDKNSAANPFAEILDVDIAWAASIILSAISVLCLAIAFITSLIQSITK